MAPISVIVVVHDSAAALRRSLPALVAQLDAGDELIVVDNDSADESAALAGELAPGATVIEAGENLGYGGGNNLGAKRAHGELLVFLNPDAVVGTDWRAAIELPLSEGRGWAAWQALITSDDGAVVNSDRGVVHFTGIAWAGDAGRPMADRPSPPSEVGFASGACLAVTRSAWTRLGGFPQPFFLYGEDVDLSLRLWLMGEKVGVEPRARVDHDYEFDKGAGKRVYLERNRWAMLVRLYPAPLLVLISPVLLVSSLASLLAAIPAGHARQSLTAWRDVIRWLPRLIAERREIKGQRAVGAGEFAAAFTASLDTDFLPAAVRSRPVDAMLRGYWSLVRLLLGAKSSPWDSGR